MRRVLFTVLLLAMGASHQALAFHVGPDSPFAPLTDADYQHLEKFSKEKGCDLQMEWQRVYRGDKKIDEEALGRVFRFRSCSRRSIRTPAPTGSSC